VSDDAEHRDAATYHAEHGEAAHPLRCEACFAAWLALRQGTVSAPEEEVLAWRSPSPNSEVF